VKPAFGRGARKVAYKVRASARMGHFDFVADEISGMSPAVFGKYADGSTAHSGQFSGLTKMRKTGA
jgi:hypothetical protein